MKVLGCFVSDFFYFFVYLKLQNEKNVLGLRTYIPAFQLGAYFNGPASENVDSFNYSLLGAPCWQICPAFSTMSLT